MAKNDVASWDTTAGNNTDVSGTNIAEGCAAGNVNNALREIMAQIAAWRSLVGQLADNEAVTGAWTFSGGVSVTTTAVDFADNVKLTFGAGTDGGIYSDGSDLVLEVANSQTMRLKSVSGEHLARFYSNAGFDLSYDNSTVISGVSGGVRVTGDINGDTVSGDMVATNVEALTGTATDHLVTPANVKHVIDNRVGTDGIFESTGNTYTNGGLITLAHGLSSAPWKIQVTAKCTTADAGFSVDDVINVPDLWNSGSNDYGVTAYADATNIYLQVGADGLRVLGAAGALGTIWTPANWELDVRAWV